MAMRYEISRLVLKKIFHYSKRNFVSPSDRVMFYSLYKYQTILRPVYMEGGDPR